MNPVQAVDTLSGFREIALGHIDPDRIQHIGNLAEKVKDVLQPAGQKLVNPVLDRPPIAEVADKHLITYLAYPLNTALALFQSRRVPPKLALWRLGATVKLSKTYSQLDPTATKLTKDTEELRANLTMLASRALRHAQLVMENAARGQFPSHAEVDFTHIAWRDISIRIRAFRKWEKAEEERLKAWYEKRQAERAAQVQARVEDRLFDIE